jgi:hypothetical protein
VAGGRRRRSQKRLKKAKKKAMKSPASDLSGVIMTLMVP